MIEMNRGKKKALILGVIALLVIGTFVVPGIWDDGIDPDYTILMSDEERYPQDEWEELDVGNVTETKTADFGHSGSGVLYHQYVRIDNTDNDKDINIVAEVEEPANFEEEQMGFIVLDDIVEPGEEEEGETVHEWGSINHTVTVDEDEQEEFTVIYVLSHEVTAGEDYEITWNFYADMAIYEVDVESPEDTDEFVEGDEIEIDYNITNVGSQAGEQDIELTVYDEDGDEVYTDIDESVELEPEEYHTGTFTWQSEEGDFGDYDLNVTSEDHEDSVTVTLLKDADFQVDIVDHTEEIEQGETATVYYTVTNIGDVNDTQDVNFTVYEDVEDEIVEYEDNYTDLELEAGETHAGTFKWDTNETHYGEYTLEVATQDDDENVTVTVWTDAYFQVTMIDHDEEVVEGEEVVLRYNVTNIGDEEDTQHILFRVFDEYDERVYLDIEESLTLGPGEYLNNTFTWPTEESDAGDYDLRVSSDDEDEEVSVTVLEQAFFEVEIVDYDEEVMVDEDVELRYNVTNVGEVEDTQNVTLEVFDEEEELVYSDKEENLTLGPGEYHNETFVWSTEGVDAGDYDMNVSSDDDSDEVNVTVLAEPRPPEWIRVEKDEDAGDLIVEWEDTGAQEYNLYYSEDQYADFGTWDELATVEEGTEYTHVDALGGENYYIVRSVVSGMESENSSMAFSVEREFVDDADYSLHYVSIPARFNNLTEVRASDIVEDIEGDLETADNIYRVVKWEYEERGWEDQYLYDPAFEEWPEVGGDDDFVIEPGDGVGIYVQDEADFSWHITGVDTEFSMDFVDDADYSLHYVSVPYTLQDYTENDELRASDIVYAIEGSLNTANNIYRVVRWEYEERGWEDQYLYDPAFEEWPEVGGDDDFVIEPGDGIGIYVQDEAEFTWEIELVTPPVGEGQENTDSQTETSDGTRKEGLGYHYEIGVSECCSFGGCFGIKTSSIKLYSFYIHDDNQDRKSRVV